MGDVTVVCPDCGTKADVAADRAQDVVDRHNERRHDGLEVAHAPGLVERAREQAEAFLGGDEAP